jgi:hypothetical protein
MASNNAPWSIFLALRTASFRLSTENSFPPLTLCSFPVPACAATIAIPKLPRKKERLNILLIFLFDFIIPIMIAVFRGMPATKTSQVFLCFFIPQNISQLPRSIACHSDSSGFFLAENSGFFN